MTDYKNIRYEVNGRIADIVLDRPKAMNALSYPLRDEVTAALGEADRNDDVRVVILSGTEESRAFSTGYDISGTDSRDGSPPPKDRGAYEWRELLDDCVRWELSLWNFRKPIIAQVHGYCLAGACELAMLADMTIVSDDAILGEPEIRFLTGPPVLVMPWIVGIKRAKQLLFIGETIDAQTALEWGMVNMVVPRDKLREETLRYANKMAVVPTEALHYTKSAINRGMEVGGLRNTVELGLELCSLLDATRTDFNDEFRRLRETEGLPAALRWTREQFDGAG